MLMRILGAVARRELRGIRRRITALAFGLAGALVAGLALVFAFLALFLWLATRFEPWQAALIVVAVLFLIACVVWFAGRMVVRRAARSDNAAEAHIQAVLDEIGLGSTRTEAPFATVGSALAIGYSIGRKLPR